MKTESAGTNYENNEKKPVHRENQQAPESVERQPGLEPKPQVPSIKKNTVYNVIKTLSSIVFPLITFPYISRVLHAENVGKIAFGNSITSYISLIASLGISTYAIRECSKVRNDKHELDDTASQIMSINIITTGIAYVILAILLLSWKSLKGYEVLILIQSMGIIFTTLGTDWLNSAMEDFRYITLRTFTFQVVSLVCMFVFVHKPEDYLAYAGISVVSSSGASVMNIFYRRRYCSVRFTTKIDWKRHLRPVLLMFAMMLSQTIFTSVDKTMLGIIRNDTEVGWYSTSVNIYNMVNQVVASVCWVVMPQLSYHFRKKNYPEINKLLKYSLNFIVVGGFPCIAGVFSLAPEIVEIIGGQEYLPAASSLRILMGALLFSFLGGLVYNIILLPSGREHICLILTIITAGVNFVLNLFVIPLWGGDAAAFTTLVGQVLGFVISLHFVEKEINLGNIKEELKAPVIGCIGIFLYVFLLKYFMAGLWLRTALSIIGGVAIYSVTVLALKNEFAMDLWNSVKARLHK